MKVKKSDVIQLFVHGKVLARYLEIDESAITRWPPELDQKRIDRCRVAYEVYRIERDYDNEAKDEKARKLLGVS